MTFDLLIIENESLLSCFSSLQINWNHERFFRKERSNLDIINCLSTKKVLMVNELLLMNMKKSLLQDIVLFRVDRESNALPSHALLSNLEFFAFEKNAMVANLQVAREPVDMPLQKSIPAVRRPPVNSKMGWQPSKCTKAIDGAA